MEGIVAKRTLKKSYYNNNRNTIYLDNSNIKQKKEKENEKFKSIKAKLLFKISLQTITIISIIAFVICIKLLNIEVVKSSDVCKSIVKQFNTNYSFSDIKLGAKNIAKGSYVFVKPIIPDEIETKVKDVFNMLINYEKKVENVDNNTEIEVYNEVNVYEESSVNNKENKIQENVGVSVDDEEAVVAVSSSVDSSSSLIDEFNKKNITFVIPVNGVVTSPFGEREVIFEGVDSYHYGTDIAANTGTNVLSSISGKVTRATYNKYNGNFVEVTNGDVATIYCHMSKLSVKVGDKVKQGEKIGEVGSTGLSTGPHLHFEIVYNGTKIDPEQVLDL